MGSRWFREQTGVKVELQNRGSRRGVIEHVVEAWCHRTNRGSRYVVTKQKEGHDVVL